MPEPINLPASLIDAVRNQNLIPFVGAAVSMSVKSMHDQVLFPSWKKLLISGAQRLRSELNDKYAQQIEDQVNENQLMEAADELKKQLGTYFIDWIKNEYNVPRQNIEDKSLNLARSLWELGSSFLITTNYDRVLRWACPQIGDLEEW